MSVLAGCHCEHHFIEPCGCVFGVDPLAPSVHTPTLCPEAANVDGALGLGHAPAFHRFLCDHLKIKYRRTGWTGVAGRSPHAGMTDHVAELERAYRVSFAQTTGPIEMHALRYIRALILRDFPTATLLRTSDSDQGPGYVFDSIEDVDGAVLCEDEGALDADLWAPLSDLRAHYLGDEGIDPYAIPLIEEYA